MEQLTWRLFPPSRWFHSHRSHVGVWMWNFVLLSVSSQRRRRNAQSRTTASPPTRWRHGFRSGPCWPQMKMSVCVCVSVQCFLTIFSRYCSRDSTVASGSIFNMRPVRSIRAVSPGALSRRKRNLRVRIWTTQRPHNLSSRRHAYTPTTLKTHVDQNQAATHLQVVGGAWSVIKMKR